jgi:hypothetical protein
VASHGNDSGPLLHVTPPSRGLDHLDALHLTRSRRLRFRSPHALLCPKAVAQSGLAFRRPLRLPAMRSRTLGLTCPRSELSPSMDSEYDLRPGISCAPSTRFQASAALPTYRSAKRVVNFFNNYLTLQIKIVFNIEPHLIRVLFNSRFTPNVNTIPQNLPRCHRKSHLLPLIKILFDIIIVISKLTKSNKFLTFFHSSKSCSISS